MNILIFGASGATGRELTRQSLAQGHIVTAFVRNPSKLTIAHDNLKLIQGDVTSYSAVETAIKNQDAVLCALGAASPLKRDPSLIEGVRNIINAMEQENILRFIYLSFLGVKESRGEMGFVVNQIAARLLRNAIADHEDKESLIRQSRLNWTIVRPPKLTNGIHTGTFRSGERIKAHSAFLQMSRSDVADFMLRQLTDGTYMKKATLVLY